MPWFSLSIGWQPTGLRPPHKRPRWYQAQPIDDPDSAAALDRIRKGLPEGHWRSNDTLGYLGRSLLDLTRSPYRPGVEELRRFHFDRKRSNKNCERSGESKLTGF